MHSAREFIDNNLLKHSLVHDSERWAKCRNFRQIDEYKYRNVRANYFDYNGKPQNFRQTTIFVASVFFFFHLIENLPLDLRINFIIDRNARFIHPFFQQLHVFLQFHLKFHTAICLKSVSDL